MLFDSLRVYEPANLRLFGFPITPMRIFATWFGSGRPLSRTSFASGTD
jgi:hypothetical protein